MLARVSRLAADQLPHALPAALPRQQGIPLCSGVCVRRAHRRRRVHHQSALPPPPSRRHLPVATLSRGASAPPTRLVRAFGLGLEAPPTADGSLVDGAWCHCHALPVRLETAQVPEPEPDDPELESYLDPPPPPPPPPPPSSLTKAPVLVCPAQFGTASDYAELVEALESRGHPTVVAPLELRDWFRLIPASLTPEYWRGELSPDVALPFYYEALDRAIDQLSAKHDGQPVQLVAHSIGGQRGMEPSIMSPPRQPSIMSPPRHGGPFAARMHPRLSPV